MSWLVLQKESCFAFLADGVPPFGRGVDSAQGLLFGRGIDERGNDVVDG